MKFKELYDLAVQYGIDCDPRGREVVEKELKKKAALSKGCSSPDARRFDKESLDNPYADTRMLYGNPDTDVKTVFVGIDVDVSELLLVNTLRAKEKIDLVVAHHPAERALASLYKVMPMQSDILSLMGVPISVSESLTSERAREVERRLSPLNHSRSVDAARLLNIPFLCLHTPADNHVSAFLNRLLKEKKPESLQDTIDLLNGISEYETASAIDAGPKVFAGDKSNKLGRFFVDMTGGTEGAKDIFANLSSAGVDTLVCMHLSDDHLKKAREAHMNVIVAGHIASDNLGLNLLFDRICRGRKLRIVSGSGFRRFEHNSKILQ